MKEIDARLEKIEPKARQSDGLGSRFASAEAKSFNFSQKRSSPKAKSTPRETLFSGGQNYYLSPTSLWFKCEILDAVMGDWFMTLYDF